MSLVISLRTPDGMVIAGDSLSTMRGNLEIKTEIKTTCPNCQYEETHNLTLDGVPIPTTTLSYAQKIFPFMGDFAVGTFGAGQLNGKTMYFAVRELEQELREQGQPMDSVMNAADRIGTLAHDLLDEQEDDLSQLPDDSVAVGFQVVGYTGDEPETKEVLVGKQTQINETGDITASGVHNVVDALMEVWENQGSKPAFNLFSLQDAINYAKFIINTTAQHQEFSRQMATVGGEIDVALITPFDGFQWIQQKDLSQQLEKSRHGQYEPEPNGGG